MTRICLNCTNKYETNSARSKYCSEACKQAAKRTRTVSPTVSRHDKSDTINDTIESPINLTKTDQLFQDYAISQKLGANWLAFSDIVRQPTCTYCDKRFKTRLPLLRHCSPECRFNEMALIGL